MEDKGYKNKKLILLILLLLGGSSAFVLGLKNGVFDDPVVEDKKNVLNQKQVDSKVNKDTEKKTEEKEKVDKKEETKVDENKKSENTVSTNGNRIVITNPNRRVYNSALSNIQNSSEDKTINPIVKVEENDSVLDILKVDKTELEKLIGVCIELKKTGAYIFEKDNSDKKLFDEILEKAKAIFTNEDANQIEVDRAVVELEIAKSKLNGVLVVDDNNNYVEDTSKVKEAKDFIEQAKLAKKTYEDELEKVNQDNLITPAEKVELEKLKTAYETAKVEAEKKVSEAKGVTGAEMLDTAELAEVADIPVVNDEDGDGVKDSEEISNARKVLEQLKNAVESAKVKKTELENEAVTAEKKKELDDLIAEANKKKKEAETVINGIPESNSDKDTLTNELSNVQIPESVVVNDEDGDGVKDSDEIASARKLLEQLKNAVESAKTKKTELENEAVTAEKKKELDDLIVEANKKKTEVETAINGIPQGNSDKDTLTNELSNIQIPESVVVNDEDGDGVKDSDEIASARKLLEQLKNAVESAKTKKTELENEVVTAEKKKELDDLIVEANKKKSEAETAINGLPESNADKDTLTNELSSVEIPESVVVNDKNNNGKDDTQEVDEAKSAINLAKEAKETYENKLNEFKGSDNLITPTEKTELENLKAAYETEKDKAVQKVEEVQDLEGANSLSTAELTDLELPEVNDKNENNKLDTQEVEEVRVFIETVKEKKTSYENKLNEFKGSDNLITPTEKTELENLKAAYETEKDKAVQKVEEVQDLEGANSLSTAELTDLELPEVNDKNENNKLDTQEVEEVRAFIETVKEKKTTYESRLTALKGDSNAITQAEKEELERLKSEYDGLKATAIQKVTEVQGLEGANSLNTDSLTDLELPTVNDTNSNDVVDSVEVEQARQLITNAKTLMDKFNDEVEKLKADGITEAEKMKLEELKVVYDDTKAKAIESYNNVKDLVGGEQLSVDELVDVVVPEVTRENDEEPEKIEKQFEFRNVTETTLYKVLDNGTLSRVSAISQDINDPQNYLAKIVNNGKTYMLPVSSVVANGNEYTVSVNQSELKTYKQDKEFTDGFKFAVEKTVTGSNIFTDFNSLVNAMKNNPNGEFKIGADLFAGEVSTETYIPTFNGKLKSVDGKKYAIHNLKKPFISATNGATIENVAFKNVDVTGANNTAVVSLNAMASTFKNLYIEGNLNFKPVLQDTRYIGGVVSVATNGTRIEKTWVKLNITAVDKANGQAVGILAGRSASSDFVENMIEGQITLTGVSGNAKSYTGKVLGSSYNNVLNKIIVDVNLTNNFNDYIGYDVYSASRLTDVKTISTSNSNTTITREDAMNKLRQWGMITEENSSGSINSPVDYTSLEGYDSSKTTIYSNMEKLLPFYDRLTIVSEGNKVESSSPFATKTIATLVPMKNNEFTVSSYDKGINKLFVKFTDNSTTVYPLKFVEEFKQSGIFEYQLEGGLRYTPEQLNKVNDNFIATLSNVLKTVDLDSQEISNTLGVEAYKNKVQAETGIRPENAKTKDLYLTDSFEELKVKMNNVIKEIISGDEVVNLEDTATQRYLNKKIEDSKNQLALALSYLNKLYNVEYGNYNIGNLMMYKQNFYNSDINNFTQLVKLGNAGFDNLLLHNNYKTFGTVLNNLKANNLIDFLIANKDMFMGNDKDVNTWFKESTKAFVHENSSAEMQGFDVSLWNALQKKDRHKSYILPLLNIKENNVYVVSIPSVVLFGGYGRSIDQALVSNKEQYNAKVAEVNETIKSKSVVWTKYMEHLYSIANEEGREYMKNHPTEAYDGFYVIDSVNGTAVSQENSQKRRWADSHDENYTAIKEFFGPIGRYYGQSGQKPSAYTRRDLNLMRFDSVDILGHEGGATLNHELVHNYDEKVVLQGFNYRQGQDSESYALGLLESIMTNNDYYYGFNFMYELSGKLAHNSNTSRVKTKEQIQSYIKGIFDTTYLLDAIEAQLILELPKHDQKYFFNKMNLKKGDTQQVEGINYNHGNDVVSTISDSEWNSMNITNIDDLVKNNLVSKTSLILPKEYLRDNANNYYFVPLYYPIYNAYSNSEGTSGGLMFRRTAFELLSEYGWDSGFIGYATNKYQSQAHAEGKPLSDEYVFKKIFNGDYNSYEEFKIDMFKKRLAKKEMLKEITVSKGRISNITELETLMRNAINEDLAKAKTSGAGFAREQLKASILKELNSITNNFEESIFR